MGCFFFCVIFVFLSFFFFPLYPGATPRQLTGWCLVRRSGCWTGPGHPRLCCVDCSGPAAAACAAADVPPLGCSSAHAQSAPDMPSTGPATITTHRLRVNTPQFILALFFFSSLTIVQVGTCSFYFSMSSDSSAKANELRNALDFFLWDILLKKQTNINSI